MTGLSNLTNLLPHRRWGLRPQTPSSSGSLALARPTGQQEHEVFGR